MSAPAFTPQNVPCRYCRQRAGDKCLTASDGAKWGVLVRYFHVMRWRDFEKTRAERAKLEQWNSLYSASEVTHA